MYAHMYVQCGSLQQLGLGMQTTRQVPLDPSLPSFWLYEPTGPAAPLLLVQTSTHAQLARTPWVLLMAKPFH